MEAQLISYAILALVFTIGVLVYFGEVLSTIDKVLVPLVAVIWPVALFIALLATLVEAMELLAKMQKYRKREKDETRPTNS